MPDMNTIEDLQAIFQGDNEEDMAAARELLKSAVFRRGLLETHGVDTSEMDDDQVKDSLFNDHSRCGLD